MATFRTLDLKKLNQARIDFTPDNFRRLILQKGMRMTWQQAAMCPCRSILSNGGITQPTGEFDPECEECFGRGVIYHTPLQIRGIFEDASRRPEKYAIYGEHISGTAGLSTLAEHALNFKDRVVLDDNRMTYMEAKTRRKTVERVRFPVAERSVVVGTSGDSTVAETITVDAAYVRKADPNGKINPYVLVEGTDFTINGSGELDWSLGDSRGTAPLIGSEYSITYYGKPTYIVIDTPYQYRNTWIKTKSVTAYYQEMPNRCVVKQEILGTPEWPHGN